MSIFVDDRLRFVTESFVRDSILNSTFRGLQVASQRPVVGHHERSAVEEAQDEGRIAELISAGEYGEEVAIPSSYRVSPEAPCAVTPQLDQTLRSDRRW